MKHLFFLAFFLLSFSAFSQTQLLAPIESTATTVSTLFAASNNTRNYLLVQNKGTGIIYVKAGSVHSGTEGVLIPAGGNWEPIQAPLDSIWIKAAAGVQAISIIQGNR